MLENQATETPLEAPETTAETITAETIPAEATTEPDWSDLTERMKDVLEDLVYCSEEGVTDPLQAISDANGATVLSLAAVRRIRLAVASTAYRSPM